MESWSLIFSGYIRELQTSDSAHDFAHVQRVVNNATKILNDENSDPEIIIPATWLHDCVSVSKDSPLRSKASKLSAEKAAQLLEEWGYPLTKISQIQHAIEAHSYSAEIKPLTLEAKIVQDADRLDSIGAIGVARMMMVGGKLDRSLYSQEDTFCKSREPNDLKWTLDHFYSKLLKLNAGFHTKSAKNEANKRHQYMLNFLDQLQSEVQP